MNDILQLIDQKNNPNFLEKLNYAFLGVSGVLGWNAVLTSLQYFDDQFQNYDISFLLPIPQLFANFFFGAILPQLRKYIHVKVCVIGSMIGMIVCLAALPLITYFMSQSQMGFIFVLILSFLLGMFNAVLQGAVVSITNVVHHKLAAIYWTYNGFSGLLMNLFYAISLLIFPSSLQTGAIFYYSISALFISIAAYFFNKYYNKKYNTEDSQQEHKLLDDGLYEQSSTKSQQSYNGESKSDYFSLIWRAFKAGFPIPLLIWLHFVQLQTVFPGLAVFKVDIGWSSNTWNSLFLITFANIGDTIGKYTAGIIKKFYNLKIIIFLIMFRFLLMAFFILSAYYTYEDEQIFFRYSYFIVLNIVIFSFLTGFCTSALMQLSPSLLNEDELVLKEQLGFVNVVMLTFGISCGTFTALSFTNFGKTS
ncbi:hypothetical protein ABPG74_012404 [Tetrahymena malaccensis]